MNLNILTTAKASFNSRPEKKRIFIMIFAPFLVVYVLLWIISRKVKVNTNVS